MHKSTYVRRMYELNQQDTVYKLMFVSLDISILDSNLVLFKKRIV